MFIHLHAHSHYSLLEALPSPVELVQAAAEAGMPALALTDHNRLTGALEFYAACQEAALQPVLGLELDVTPPPEFSAYSVPSPRPVSLVLLAQDLPGWSALCCLASLAQSDSAGSTPVPFERLAACSSGLLCLSGGLRGFGLYSSLSVLANACSIPGWVA